MITLTVEQGGGSLLLRKDCECVCILGYTAIFLIEGMSDLWVEERCPSHALLNHRHDVRTDVRFVHANSE